ncbi:hypothetical protein QUF72_08955 [Desulfobacterales bacterium HSG2]|nr:hypothetical protein [Desulfobacterales bacterium HSG2]
MMKRVFRRSLLVWTGYFSEKFEESGFFFAGVLPGGMSDKDALILQYLNNVEIYYYDINVNSAVADDMLSYIKNYDPNLL